MTAEGAVRFRIASLVLFLQALAADLVGWHRWGLLLVARTAREALEGPWSRRTAAELLRALHSCPVLRETGDQRAHMAASATYALCLAVEGAGAESAHVLPLPEDIASNAPRRLAHLLTWQEGWGVSIESLESLGWNDDERKLWLECWTRARVLESRGREIVPTHPRGTLYERVLNLVPVEEAMEGTVAVVAVAKKRERDAVADRMRAVELRELAREAHPNPLEFDREWAEHEAGENRPRVHVAIACAERVRARLVRAACTVAALVVLLFCVVGCGTVAEQGPPGPQGEQGDVGPRGERGPMGPSGTVTLATYRVLASSDLDNSIEAFCDEGDEATGGGCDFHKLWGTALPIVDDEDRPIGWSCEHARAESSGVAAHVVCQSKGGAK